jgi:hypothetical protein
MKKIIFFLSLFVTDFLCAQSSYPVIYTPSGTSIFSGPGDCIISSYYDSVLRINYPDAVIIDTTYRIDYNCHSYAWNVSEGGANLWISQMLNDNTTSNLAYYWTDGSYIETDTLQAEKIFYDQSDHSAIKDPNNPGKYISKWGNYYLMRHTPTDLPYNATVRHYYKRNIPYIICSSGTCTIPGGTPTPIWSVTPSSIFSVSPSSGSTNTNVSYFGEGGSAGTLTANYSGNLVSRLVYGVAMVGISYISANVSEETYALPTNLPFPVSDIQWSVSPASYQAGLTPSTNSMSATFNKAASGFCSGSSSSATVTIMCSFTAYGKTYDLSKYVTLYKPVASYTPSIDGVYRNATKVTSGTSGQAHTLKANASSAFNSYVWNISSSSSSPMGANGVTANITFPSAGNYTIKLRANNGCTMSPEAVTTFTVIPGVYFTLSPNPVSSGGVITLTRNSTSLPSTTPTAGFYNILTSLGSSPVCGTISNLNNNQSIYLPPLSSGAYQIVILQGSYSIQSISFVIN